MITESRSGREAVFAKAFVDSTGYGDLAAFAGADFVEPNDYAVVNSIGVGGVSVEKYHEFFAKPRRGEPVRRGLAQRRAGPDRARRRPREQAARRLSPTAAREIGMSLVTTTVHDDYFMFIKINFKMPVSPTDRDAVAAAELELRQRQAKAIELLRAVRARLRKGLHRPDQPFDHASGAGGW